MSTEPVDDRCDWPLCPNSPEIYGYCMSHAPPDVCELFLLENGDDLTPTKKTILQHYIDKKKNGNFVVDTIR